jgi:hypothetical protein
MNFCEYEYLLNEAAKRLRSTKRINWGRGPAVGYRGYLFYIFSRLLTYNLRSRYAQIHYV